MSENKIGEDMEKKISEEVQNKVKNQVQDKLDNIAEDLRVHIKEENKKGKVHFHTSKSPKGFKNCVKVFFSRKKEPVTNEEIDEMVDKMKKGFRLNKKRD